MTDAGNEPRVFGNRFADALGPPGDVPDRDRCRCVGHSATTRPATVAFHPVRQDTDSPGWRRLLTLVDEAAVDGRAVFKPGVWGADAVRTCSVCNAPVDRELHQAWISLSLATDVLPLLVNACSAACVAALPTPRPGYVPAPHIGGPDLVQPTTRP